MQLDDAVVGDAVKRLRRAEGQIRGVIAMLESGRDCADVVTQLAAASRALDRAGFKIIASGLQQCLAAKSGADGAAGDDDELDMHRLERLFMSLA
jgi:DNA-binding FrmR family transcriptional regulator